MDNAHIADAFEQVADLLEFQNANPFRVRAYRNGARKIRDLPQPAKKIVEDSDRRITDIEGIGKDLAEKIATLVATGELPQLAQLLEEIPESVLTLMRVPGLGPKKAAVLFHELGITTLAQLKEDCERGRVCTLKGFGAKTEQSILKGLSVAEDAGKRIYWAQADDIVTALRDHFSTCEGVQQLELAGSYRRGKETVGDLDLLVVAGDSTVVMDRFGEFPAVAETIARGPTKMSIRTRAGFQIDLRVVPEESFGAALQYFTGSKDHNVAIRGMARQRGLKINEYGVFLVDGDKETYVAGALEEDVYGALELPVFPPELREARRELEWAEQGALPKLVTLADICGDLHVHTNETDGRATLEEMAAAAQQRGLKYLAITDHSKRVSMARGLDAQRLLKQWKAIDLLNPRWEGGFVLLKGIECDILEKGGMDLPDEVLAQADWVNASIHYGQQQSRQQITERMLEAIEHPSVTALAHPTGRLLNRREPYEIDLDAVFQAARQRGTLLELNANPMRLDLHDIYCATARNLGISIVISTDAHSTDGLDDMRFGVLQARRGGLTKRDVANTRTWPQLKELIGK
ncbi:MAG: DNA polymerase/3'-5' exonuclease PolX [Pirellulaceae bacterium]